MYSPKIKEDLVLELYEISKEVKKPMTKVVNDILKSYINFYKKYKTVSPNILTNTIEYIIEKYNGDET